MDTSGIRLPSRGAFFAAFLLVVVVFAMADLTRLFLNRGDFTPFSVDYGGSALVYDETQLYAPGPRRIERTGKLASEVDVYELRNRSISYPILHSIVLGWPARLAGLEAVWVAAHGLLPALLWLLLVFEARRLGLSLIVASAAASITVLVSFGPRNFFLLGRDALIQPLEATRTPHPSLSTLALFLAVFLTADAAKRDGVLKIALAIFVSGALFYTYYYAWIAFFVGISLWFVALALTGARGAARRVLGVGSGGVILGLPFLLVALESTHTGSQRDLMERVGDFGRTPNLSAALLFLLLTAALLIFGLARTHQLLPDDHAAAGLLAVCSGGALGINLQVLTGFDAQHAHFFNRVLQPLGVFLFVAGGLVWILSRFPRIRQVVCAISALTIVGLLLLASFRQVQVGLHTAELHRRSNPRVEVLSWAREHLAANDVLGTSDDRLLTMIPAIAGNWTFVPLGDRSLASRQEILTRYLVLCRLEGFDWERTRMRLKHDAGGPNNWVSMPYVLLMMRPLPAEWEELARNIWEGLDLSKELALRRLDYLLWPAGQPLDPLREFFLAPVTVHRNTEWQIVRVN